MGASKLGVVAFPDSYGVIKLFPEPTIGRLRLVGGSQSQGIQLPNDGAALLTQQNLAVGAVIEEEILILKSGTEVSLKQWEYPVFGFNLCCQNTIVVGEADEALE